MARGACRGRREASLNTLHKLNANENTRLLEAAEAIVAPVLEAGQPAASEGLLSGSDSFSIGLAVAPVTPALALAQ